MTTYIAIKHVHAVAVAVSFGLFFLRGVWMMLDSARLDGRWVRVVPHVNDTVLLAAGIWLAFELRLSPAATPWLGAKLIALPVYIGLGALALRPGRPKRVRVAAWMAALVVFGYIAAVAVTRSVSL
ncbi:MAG TPA: SirB2 family protein [Burkholderiales bacterium]|nr:SirB2 family protein [Burkholderiales bacterium]